MTLFKARLREVPFWEQVKIICRAWFWVKYDQQGTGRFFAMRLPLGAIYIYRSFQRIEYTIPWTGILLCFWPNLPIEDGGLIYKYQKEWDW